MENNANISLYNISNKFVELFEKGQTQELTQKELQEQGEELAQLLVSKSAGIIAYSKNTEALVTSIDEEIKRLQEYKKVVKAKQDKFNDYVKENMEKLGLSKVETPLGVLSVAKCPLSVEIVDEELIPTEYKEDVITTKIDKTALKQHFKETGELIDGVNFIADKKALRIK